MRNEKGQFVKGNSGFWLGKKRTGLKTSTGFNLIRIPETEINDDSYQERIKIWLA